MDGSLVFWQLVGVLAIVVGGTLLHFAYGWSGRWLPLALITPVNDSVWEHLKMAYWPLCALTLVELVVLDPAPPGLACGAALAFCAMAAVMLGLFYLSAALLREPPLKVRLVVDGATFVAAVALGQVVGYLAVRDLGRHLGSGLLGGILLLLPAVVLTLTTFRPPRLPIFRDAFNGQYGISAGRPARHHD